MTFAASLILAVLCALFCAGDVHAETGQPLSFFDRIGNFFSGPDQTINTYSGGPLTSSTAELVDIRLLKSRPAGAGGILPFSVSDIRRQIDPDARSAPTTTPGGGGTPPTSGGGTVTITCPNGTQFPTAGSFNPTVDLVIPTSSGTCSLVGGPSAANAAFEVRNFTSTSAEIMALNGWSVSNATIFSGLGTPANNFNFRITKGSQSFTMTLQSQSSGAGGGNITIQNFTSP